MKDHSIITSNYPFFSILFFLDRLHICTAPGLPRTLSAEARGFCLRMVLFILFLDSFWLHGHDVD